jgi:hypothetical protein
MRTDLEELHYKHSTAVWFLVVNLLTFCLGAWTPVALAVFATSLRWWLSAAVAVCVCMCSLRWYR